MWQEVSDVVRRGLRGLLEAIKTILAFFRDYLVGGGGNEGSWPLVLILLIVICIIALVVNQLVS